MNSLGLCNVLKSIVHQTTTTAMVLLGVAIDQLLLAEGHQLASNNCVYTFYSTSCAKCPAGTTLQHHTTQRVDLWSLQMHVAVAVSAWRQGLHMLQILTNLLLVLNFGNCILLPPVNFLGQSGLVDVAV